MAHITPPTTFQSYRYVQTFRQSFLPSFPCPIMLTSGDNCSASRSPSVFGTGNCHGCSLYRQFLWKTHVSDSPPPSPYQHALYLGYERAVIANLEDSLHELMLALASTIQGSTFHKYSTHQQEWWEISVHPTPQEEDPLSELPKFTDVINYQLPNKFFFLQSQAWFSHMGYDIPSCNIQNSSMILTLCLEAFTSSYGTAHL